MDKLTINLNQNANKFGIECIRKDAFLIFMPSNSDLIG
jgi:hypothetical protein